MGRNTNNLLRSRSGRSHATEDSKHCVAPVRAAAKKATILMVIAKTAFERLKFILSTAVHKILMWVTESPSVLRMTISCDFPDWVFLTEPKSIMTGVCFVFELLPSSVDGKHLMRLMSETPPAYSGRGLRPRHIKPSIRVSRFFLPPPTRSGWRSSNVFLGN